MANSEEGSAQKDQGVTLVTFTAALTTALVVFVVQMFLFNLLRNKLARIYKPKTYMVPQRERTDPPKAAPWSLLLSLLKFPEREIIKKCGLDAYFFLRYMQMLLIIFVPVAFVAIPVLVPLNYIGGLGKDVVTKEPNSNNSTNSTNVVNSTTSTTTPATNSNTPSGLDTLAWGNLNPKYHTRRWAHLVMAITVVIWVCFVCFTELRVYIKIRQDYLTSASHRLRASATTVLVNSVPEKWLTEEALRGLFDVFPGGIRNIWITRDFTKLLSKVHKRDKIVAQLESAQSKLIREVKKQYLKRRKADEKKEQRANRERRPTKQDILEREKAEDNEAKRRAESGAGISAGDHEPVPHVHDPYGGRGRDGDASLYESDGSDGDLDKEERTPRSGGSGGRHVFGKVGKVGQGIGQGLKGGVNAVGKAGHGIRRGVDGQLGRTGGFEFVQRPGQGDGSDRYGTSSRPQTSGSDQPAARTVQILNPPDLATRRAARHTSTASLASQTTTGTHPATDQPQPFGNTTRKLTNLESMYIQEETKWWQFWKPPSGGYASPVPQGQEGDEFPLNGPKRTNSNESRPKTFWGKLMSAIPFLGGDDKGAPEYPLEESAFKYTDNLDDDAEWKKYIKKSKRPTHRLALFKWTPAWLPGLPLINKKVDTIYWCRGELARLNMEIEEDRKHPERYPAMKSAFIQFNNQVAAHMACQSITHHVPEVMGPRMIEISPNEVIWDNMAIGWLSGWIRTAIVLVVVTGMVILWAIPVAFTSTLSQIDSLIRTYSWLGFLQSNGSVYSFLKIIAGVLPAIMLSLLLWLVPLIFNWLAEFQGAKTLSQKAESVQVYYFMFLFVQVFLVVSIASGAITTLQDTVNNVTGIPETLAKNLPRAANYFFSYMILQALSTSSGTLLQIGTLFGWFIISRLMDNTARNKWARQVLLPSVSWGTFFPVYTNFACIALVYSVVAPLISIFAIITFGLLSLAHRYNMLYVTRFKTDTGGVLFPRAINQLFTGLYVMELCLAGLFFLAKDDKGVLVGYQQGIIMIAVLVLTILYQYTLNSSFGPLFRYLPITFEDEAVLRDEIFQRKLNRGMGIPGDEDDPFDEASSLNRPQGGGGDDIEMRKLSNKGRTGTAGSTSRLAMLSPAKGIRHAGDWAAKGGKQIRQATFGKTERNHRQAAEYRKERRQKDLEAQRAIGEALYGGYHDEIEDLTPEERDELVREAFQHEAQRARRRAVWIPQDDIGVSDDEIARATRFSEYLWMSNEGTALDSKARVIYGRAPPDFSEVDLIAL